MSLSYCKIELLYTPDYFSVIKPFNYNYKIKFIACYCYWLNGYDVDIFSITLLYFLTIIGISYFLLLLRSFEYGVGTFFYCGDD